MFLLDTNVISELRKGDVKAHPNVLAWARTADTASLFISAISILELERGIQLLERRDEKQGARLRAWFEQQVLQTFEDRVLAIDIAIARRCAALHVPDPRSERDALIAATALVHGMTIVTRNVADFAGTGANLVNPWE